MRAVINGKTYHDWQLTFTDGHYRLSASIEDGGPMVELKDYGMDSVHAYLDFDEINICSINGREMTL